MNLSYMSRLIDVHYEIASGIGLGERALGVEQCACGLGYSGLSCEVGRKIKYFICNTYYIFVLHFCFNKKIVIIVFKKYNEC